MQIKVENLSHAYGSKKTKSIALENVSLTINEGEFFGIIGQTGSGKSTFVQHLNGLIKAQQGSVMVGEYNLTDKNCNFKELRSKIGMVFQYPEYQLFAETVFEDVAFGLKNFFPTLSKEEVEEKVKSAIEMVGLDYYKVKDKSPFDLSGGQKRRVAIAGVIVSRPEILVLDEPVAGLDPKGKREFVALLKSLHNSFVKTIIIVSHDMNLVSENCSNVAVFKKGQIIETGTPKEIFSDSELLDSCGLEKCTTAFLTEKLKEVGLNVDSNLTIDDFIKAYLDAKGVKL